MLGLNPAAAGDMFKKEVNERSRALLKNKETRSFKQSLLDKFPKLQADDLSIILNSKAQVFVGKIGAGTKDVLYSTADGPLVIDLNSSGDFVPTLFFLSICPNAVRCFEIFSPVSSYLLNGADLMMPGVCNMAGKIRLPLLR